MPKVDIDGGTHRPAAPDTELVAAG
jgi:hypothetical protein